MTRVRVSTTVDGDRLAQARELLGVRDAELFDRALAAVIRDVQIDKEMAQIDRFPFLADPELAMPDAPGDALDELAYDGPVPEDVQRLAAQRRRQRDAGA